ncbi:hypothetical protein W97_05024 [Coniosporium apollinis CBS 100218]|uniref:NACHT domain-containing protein n=1 Tax=Coniosporium apollinis (strain CBS 100218) TaxID=1168221 RepID=R7YV27_CONA1|nr:uncharacterized protein W97_05024 [Coniosporium apollinis CBS 100218]EON65785.1 hypothetical protein W97_05024 [Coniosporium apollinis CBS 100218]
MEGTVVGVVSLGLQVCKGLVDYYDSWKSYSGDIAATHGYLEGLQKALGLLKESLKSHPPPANLEAAANESIAACKEGVGRLENKLRKVEQTSKSRGLKGKMQAQTLRAFYPFKESTLAKLKEVVQDLQSNLGQVMSAVHMDMDATTLKTLKAIGVRIDSIADDTAEIRRGTAGIRTDTNDIRTKMAGTSTDIAGIRTDTARLRMDTAGLLMGTSHIQQTIQSSQTEENKQKILEWLTRADPSSNHNEARKKHEPKTGDWLLQSQVYRNWKASPNSLLWLYGKAGCGKTILCSSAIEDVKHFSANQSIVAYFYFSFRDVQKQTFKNFVLSIIAQICHDRPISQSVKALYEHFQNAEPPTDRIEETLRSVIQEAGDLYIIMDALDECIQEPGRREIEEVLRWLEELSGSMDCRARVLITSRKEREIEEVLLSTLQAPAICVESAQIEEDIRRYVTSELDRDRRFRRLNESPKEEIKITLADKADGMFRWVYCQIEELKRLKSMRPKDVRSVLESLPRTLDETYERILTSIHSRYQHEAFRALRHLVFSERLLTLEELAEASIVDPDAEPQVDEMDRFEDNEMIDILSSLVAVVSPSKYSIYPPGTKMVQLAHFSVQEYLLSQRIQDSPACSYAVNAELAHSFIVKSCLAYVSFYSLHPRKASSKADLKNFTFLKYACETWVDYVKKCASQDQLAIITLAASTMSSQTVFLDWVRIHRPDVPWRATFEPAVSTGSPLYYAAYCGLYEVAALLLSKGADVNAQTGLDGSALQVALARGYKEIAELLLSKGADVNAQGALDGTALQVASARGYKEIVELLLSKGADVTAQGGRYGSALQAASLSGYKETVELLLSKGADVNMQGGPDGSALQAASFSNYQEIVELLLSKGAYYR